jgi:hemolysin III
VEKPLKAPVSPWTHTVGTAAALLGLAYLGVRFRGDVASLVVTIIYGTGLVAMMASSALYHWVGGAGRRRNAVLRRVDHASIYLMIAGSYTPLLYFGLSGAWRSITLACVWLLAGAGIVATTWFVGAPRALSAVLYGALGWAAIIPASHIAAVLSPTAIALVALGGILYSAGALIYATRIFDFVPGRFGFHEVFHVFVVAGAAVHFVAIAFFVVPA